MKKFIFSKFGDLQAYSHFKLPPMLPPCFDLSPTPSNFEEPPTPTPMFETPVGNPDHKDCLIYSGGTDWPGELCYNFSISDDLPQMVNFPTQITDCDSHGPALLDLFLTSDASICSTMAFSPLGNCDHVVVSVSIDFLHQIFNGMPRFIA